MDDYDNYAPLVCPVYVGVNHAHEIKTQYDFGYVKIGELTLQKFVNPHPVYN